MRESPPVIAIDGPAASGKGTVAARVAAALGFHLLDSGALYRLVALKALETATPVDDEARVAALASALDVRFDATGIFLEGHEATDAIRAEPVSKAASAVAVHPEVRRALFDLQRAFCVAPGLVADGRDMGTVVFPEAVLKVFVTASPEERAKRRYKQLIEKGNPVTLEGLLRDILERDTRDAGRAAAPLKPAADAVILDTTGIGVGNAVDFVLAKFRTRASGNAT
ncbi:MAG: (d)CMP kinase [Casimicrobiaceae bacterium]